MKVCADIFYTIDDLIIGNEGSYTVKVDDANTSDCTCISSRMISKNIKNVANTLRRCLDLWCDGNSKTISADCYPWKKASSINLEIRFPGDHNNDNFKIIEIEGLTSESDKGYIWNVIQEYTIKLN
jgi:hypothetical protein